MGVETSHEDSMDDDTGREEPPDVGTDQEEPLYMETGCKYIALAFQAGSRLG